VFPSRTDTYGLVLLEALASGIPVAAYPVAGPRDVIGAAPVGVLDWDLRRACLEALRISPPACRAFAQGLTWEASARAFVGNAVTANPRQLRRHEQVLKALHLPSGVSWR
jgi:glycosyltransferase involved in cell wall biosynthesis